MKKLLSILVLFSSLHSNILLADVYEADFEDRSICNKETCAPFITPAFLTCNVSKGKLIFYTTDKKDTCKTHVYIEKYKIENLISRYCTLAKELYNKNINTSDFLLSAMGCN